MSQSNMTTDGYSLSALDNLTRARLNMVESQIRAGGVIQPALLEALAQLPREIFVPGALGVLAYAEVDTKLPPHDRYLIAPPLLARLIDAAGVCEGDLVLDIGCATGYSTAVLAKLVGIGTVMGLESDAALAGQATQILERLGMDNVVIIHDSLDQGYPAQGPYDVILFNGASARPPETLAPIFEPQLRLGGRCVGVFDEGGDIKGHIWRWTKEEEGLKTEILFDARAPILPGFEAEKAPFRFPGLPQKRQQPRLIPPASEPEVKEVNKTRMDEEKKPSPNAAGALSSRLKGKEESPPSSPSSWPPQSSQPKTHQEREREQDSAESLAENLPRSKSGRKSTSEARKVNPAIKIGKEAKGTFFSSLNRKINNHLSSNKPSKNFGGKTTATKNKPSQEKETKNKQRSMEEVVKEYKKKSRIKKIAKSEQKEYPPKTNQAEIN